MKKILLKISYDGTNYAGWQRQKNALSIQQVIEDSIFKLTNYNISLIAASRTDAGVHALDQTACFNDLSNIPANKFYIALNTILPEDIRVLSSYEVKNEFHPRYDATSKTYAYTIYNSNVFSVLNRNTSCHIPNKLNIENMINAAKLLLGEHDFSAFQSSGSKVKTTIRTIYKSEIILNREFIIYKVNGNGFLYNMVRIIVGTLIDIGKGKLDKNIFNKAFDENNRRVLGQTAPAKGLILEKIEYKDFFST